MNRQHLLKGIQLAKLQSKERSRMRTVDHFIIPSKVRNIIHHTIIMTSGLLAIVVGLMIYIQMNLLEMPYWFTTIFAILWIVTTLYWYLEKQLGE